MTGTQLGHYIIDKKLGEGGLGVVYKARDTRLLRPVAIKILPPHLVSDQTIRLRFIQEARAASALNHPNICTVYDIGESANSHYIVMEYIDGETLRDILYRRGRLPEAEVVKIALQVCDALEAAHKKSLVHRDIKPENIMLTGDQRVKVLDFGLAKLATENALTTSENISSLDERQSLSYDRESKWRSSYATTLSTLLGTPGYMSPEQIQHEEIDERTDIFSLGIVLYELCFGQRPFGGNTNAEVMKSILVDIPSIDIHEDATISKETSKVILKALKKSPAVRFQDANEIIRALTDSPPKRSAVGLNSKQKMFFFSSAAFSLVLLGLGILYFMRQEPAILTENAKVPFATAKTHPITNWPGLEDEPSFSPDGSKIAFISDRSGNIDIWIKDLLNDESYNLTSNTEKEALPSWSPNGNEIAYESEQFGGSIFVTDLTTKGTRIIAKLGEYPAWSPDGTRIVFGSKNLSEGKNLYIINAAGGRPELFAHSDGSDYLTWPSWSFDGNWIAYAKGGQMSWNIHAQGVSTQTTISLTNDTYFNIYPVLDTNAGGIFFRSDRGGIDDVWFMRFKSDSLEEQNIYPVTFGAEVNTFDVSSDGSKLAYSKIEARGNIFAVNLRDKNQGLRRVTNWNRFTLDPSISPDGKKILMTSNVDGNYDLWICDRDGHHAKVFYRPKDSSESPVWSPDGKKIVFIDGDGKHMELLVMSVESGEITQLTNNNLQDIKPNWSPDGQWIAFTREEEEGEIYIMSVSGDSLRQLTSNPAGDTSPTFSPDGKAIAFTSLRDGSKNVWLMPVAGGAAQQITFDKEAEGGLGICWSPDGGFLYYAPVQNGVRNVWKVSRDGKYCEQITFYNSSTNHVRRSTNLSTDGKELFFASYERVGDLWILEGNN